MQRAVRDIRQRSVLIAHEALEGAAVQPQQPETGDPGTRFRRRKASRRSRISSMRANARSGPPGANVTLPASAS